MADDTTTLLVHGLNGEGPADIVGAFANEANVDPDAIGAIDLDDGAATVEVQSGVAVRIMQALDGGRIGTSRVSIAPLDAETESARAYVDRLTGLVETEREEEMRRHEREIKKLSGREREDRGRARRKAVVVGNADTVSEGDVFDRFIRYAGTEGRVVRF